MSALLFATDLLFSSRVSSSARRHGVALAVVGSNDAVLEALQDEAVDLVMIDLTARQLELTDLLARIGELGRSPRIIAYGPHVNEELLANASSAGCEVLTRGQFDQQLNQLWSASD